MKQYLIKLSILLLLVLLVNTLPAQSLKIGPGGGLNLIQSPTGFTESDGGLDFNSEYFLGGRAELSFPVLPLTLYATVFYTKLQGTPKFESMGVTYDVETSSSLLSSAVGAEYNIMPGPISIYLAAQYMFTTFGDLTTNVNGVELTTDGMNRSGLAGGAGLNINILPKIDVDLNVMYNYYNLMGKEDGEETLKSLSLSANFLFSVF